MGKGLKHHSFSRVFDLLGQLVDSSRSHCSLINSSSHYFLVTNRFLTLQSRFNGQVNCDSEHAVHFYPTCPLDAENYLRQYIQLHANNVTTNTTLVLGSYFFARFIF